MLILSVVGSCPAQSLQVNSLINLSEIAPKRALAEIEQQLAQPEITNSERAMLTSLKADTAYYLDQPDLILAAAKFALASNLLNPRWQVKTLITMARGYEQMKDYKQYLATAEDAVRKSDQFDLKILKAAALIERATAIALFDDFEKSSADLALANRYLMALPDNFTKGVMQERYTGALRLLSRFEDAIASQQKSINIFQQTQSVHFLSISHYNLGRVYESIGDVKSAIKQMERSYQLAQEDNNKLNQAFSLSRLASYQFKLNQTVEAKNTLNKAIQVADESPSFKVQFLARKDLAVLTCSNNVNLACQEALTHAISFAEKYRMSVDRSELMQKLANVYFQNTQYQLAYQTLKQAIALR
ncbi:Tetratricopeptide repeat-containing protein [Colwellia chukchiensis]|uniref:Tetratricopeptide repeat-containing protein n=2 Tax=Colwellia chukchiensis TaxID=641665 RepID=A0A1H7M5G1_9GAMM|nr:tetratricopeptide repeat protein [Colwellia chukchiensis]SEL06362.1 Tetratricopeptide repeat-containing protein [Colwellia chukchiensis]